MTTWQWIAVVVTTGFTALVVVKYSSALSDVAAERDRALEQLTTARAALEAHVEVIDRQREELQRLRHRAQAWVDRRLENAPATPAGGAAADLSSWAGALNRALWPALEDAAFWIRAAEVFIGKTGDLVVRKHGLEQRATFDPGGALRDQIVQLDELLQDRKRAGEKPHAVDLFGEAS